jgi:nucleoside phosphorylase
MSFQALDSHEHHPPIDFAILTAISLERIAVCKAFGLSDKNRVKVNGHPYWHGRVNIRDMNQYYEIVVAQLSDMANIEAAIQANNVIHDWTPSAVLLVGIAGAAHDDIQLGDVIIGQETYYYERGKATAKGKLPEPKRIPADALLFTGAISATTWRSTIKAQRPDGKRQRPIVRHGVMASGELVVADNKYRDEITSVDRKILAIEMESYGFSRAAWQSRIPCLTIKAISDAADRKKKDNWQPYAAAAAASFTKHFLDDRPIEPLISKSGSAHQPVGVSQTQLMKILSANPYAYLHQFEDGQLKHSYTLRNIDSIIGRSTECDIILPANQRISRRHARIWRLGPTKIFVEPLSDGCVYINRLKIEQPTRLQNDDLIVLGGRNKQGLCETTNGDCELKFSYKPHDLTEKRTE